MCPALAHQKPGRALVVLVVPDVEPGRGCSGERVSMYEQAAVPGSSDPSGQSHELSFNWDASRTMEGLLMQVKVDLLV
jgi:hypothetical protein